MNIDREYIIKLYEIYKGLLTEKEKSYFEYYYFEDYSLNEIADLYKVSKAYTSKYLNKINKNLLKYEDTMHIESRKCMILTCLEEINDEKVKDKIEELL
ncbi:MAG: DNA-binding protein [Bacilli bacterium]|nr:DNA-binding protein [Bacilli bacterium]